MRVPREFAEMTHFYAVGKTYSACFRCVALCTHRRVGHGFQQESLHFERTKMLCLIPLLLLLPLPSIMSGFRQCPSPCLCYESSDLVDCRSQGLDQVPPGVSSGTWLLDLSGNRVREVRSDSFVGLWSLKFLLMSNNSIHAVHPQVLRLDHNLMQHVDSSSLRNCDNLRKLDLSYNRIRTIDTRAFHSLSRLRLLHLEGNRLNMLKDGLLSRQQSLEVLLLGHNNISAIEAEALAPLRGLTLLGLRGNQLQHIKFKTFLKLQTISTHLQMSLNPWTCDCDLQRVFGKIQYVRHLHVEDYKAILCHAPPQQAGSPLASMDSQLCMAETASVLVITITVMLAVIGALVKAERNRKNKQAASDAESSDK
ncbi:leucine-rich repeat-containing G-protein coupled receptor 6-like isoform X2 [Xiphophorus maculatus]|uniref:leucine-rich repeat-containing G-protein coupled receptor 6-like isoform X2 n=1 Tax=Xiphophorus maculatus TaxID=8083 RepID=UPI000C6DAEF4|nr:leucine-rich repeat-containing G-protein coupled receptor 6-like isoform X2 [Xiphophorus maculatus]